jgi:BirA family biotin operon repressor/biotin-[acetyl-CoA-carboxylase] ligase
MSEPSFPPLLSGQAVEGSVDPFEKACALAALGCDGGLVVHNVSVNELRAAIVFAPEVALQDAMAMLPVCGTGFQNALGALAPPEVAVHLQWGGGILVNGASCGAFRVAASDDDPKAVPDWLVVGLQLPLWDLGENAGATPDQTSLYGEGCADVDAVQLLESWAKHTLVWINRWSDDGVKPVHTEWLGLAHGIGDDIEIYEKTGTFLGVGERFGMLLRDKDETHLLPMTKLLGN